MHKYALRNPITIVVASGVLFGAAHLSNPEAQQDPKIEESPYKPEAFDSCSIMPIAHVTAHKVMQSLAKLYRFLSAQIQIAS